VKRWSRAALALCALLPLAPAAAEQSAQPAIGEELVDGDLRPWRGDLDGMLERTLVRVGTTFDPTDFHIIDGLPAGRVVKAAEILEDHLNKGRPGPHIDVVIFPGPADELLDWLVEGRVDIVASDLTITAQRAARVAFTRPLARGIAEQIVLAKHIDPPVSSLDDLAARKIEVHVTRGSSYAQHLAEVNAVRTKAGQRAIPVVEAAPHLHDEDLLDLVAAGTFPATVMDSSALELWKQVYAGVSTPPALVINRDGAIAWAVRKDSPGLLALLDGVVPTLGNPGALRVEALRRLVDQGEQTVNALDDTHASRLGSLYRHFQRHGDAFRFDWLLLAAQGFQESHLDPSARSHTGAVGIMQLLPSTAREPYVGIPDITDPERNIAAGAKYNRWLIDTYFMDDDIPEEERMLFALAAYNAGAGNVHKARRRAAAMNLDPNRWFGNVEVAMGKYVSGQPVVYVRHIYKYYAAYKLHFEETGAQRGGG